MALRFRPALQIESMDIITALNRLIAQVTEEEMRATPYAERWAQVRDWLAAVAPSALASSSLDAVELAERFPLSGAELRQLHAAVEAVVGARAARMGRAATRAHRKRAAAVAALAPRRVRLHESLARLEHAARALALLSALALLVDCAALLRIHSGDAALLLATSTGVTALALGGWIAYQRELARHRLLMRAAVPPLSAR